MKHQAYYTLNRYSRLRLEESPPDEDDYDEDQRADWPILEDS